MKRWRLKWRDASKEKPKHGAQVLLIKSSGSFQAVTYLDSEMYINHFNSQKVIQWASLPDVTTQSEYLACED